MKSNNNKEEKINSFEVPKHRHKRLFMLQNNYISESEGLILNSVYKGATDLTNNLDGCGQ